MWCLTEQYRIISVVNGEERHTRLSFDGRHMGKVKSKPGCGTDTRRGLVNDHCEFYARNIGGHLELMPANDMKHICYRYFLFYCHILRQYPTPNTDVKDFEADSV